MVTIWVELFYSTLPGWCANLLAMRALHPLKRVIMRVDDFDFELPENRIALRPARPRDSARLLVVPAEGEWQDKSIMELAGFVQPGDLLVFNNTSVLPTRLYGSRGEVRVEITLHKRQGNGRWAAFAKPGKRLKPGDRVNFSTCECRVAEKLASGEVILDFGSDDAVEAVLQGEGVMPLPPYIAGKRSTDEQDAIDYQTLYAERPGAVASPTAGLHFTDTVFRALEKAGAHFTFLTLHVGAGTFLPVKVEDTSDHIMHAEFGEIAEDSARLINQTRAEGCRIIAVGTTSLRLLESAADENGQVHPFSRETNIFIEPGYNFRAVDLLLTNFHLPRSTLFMLVSAFSGLDVMKRAYAHAIDSGYRFYSYGDACLLYPRSDAK